MVSRALKFLIALAALWLILSLLAEGESTQGLAVAIAWTVAIAFVFAQDPNLLRDNISKIVS